MFTSGFGDDVAMLMRSDCVPDAAFVRQPAAPSFWTRLVQRIEGYFEYRRELRSLLTLDDHMLRDIGLNRADVMRIAGQPYRPHTARTQRCRLL